MTPANLQKLRDLRARVEDFAVRCELAEYTDTDEAWDIMNTFTETLTDIITEETKP